MIAATLLIFRRYALGIKPFPNLYVTWFEHNSPETITKMWAGTSPNTLAYQRSSTYRWKSKKSFLHPGRTLLE